jgi:beta-lactamase regulating signal transducer with metallopeptidase domain
MRLDNRAGPQTAVEPPSPARSCWPEAVWAFGAVAVALRAAWARMFLGRFRRRCRPACDEAVLGRVRRLAARLGLRRPVRVLVADRLVAPVVFGSLRPAIALPVRFGHDFDERQQEAVLAHEMAHLAAGDPAWYFLAGLVCALLWWHPLAWWSRGRLRAASEALADEASLLVPDGPSLLAASLVAVGRRLLGPRRLGWISIEGNGFRSGLGRRVERLMKLRPRPWRSPRRGRAVCVKTALTVALACVAVSCTAWAQPQAPSIEGGTTMSVLRTSWRCSLAAAALWAMTGPSGGNVADGQPPAKPAPDQGSTRPSDRPRDDDLMKQRQKLYEQVQAVRSDLRDHPDSKELQATLQTLMDQMKALPRPGAGPGAGGPGRPDGRGDLENKISHLRAAAENLRAAGMGEQADGILRMVERMRAAQREGMAPGRPGPGGPPPRDGMGPGPGGPPPRDGQGPGRYSPGGPSPREGMGPGGPEGAPREIMELRTEVQEMRREMRELRDQVKHLVENQRSDRK